MTTLTSGVAPATTTDIPQPPQGPGFHHHRWLWLLIAGTAAGLGWLFANSYTAAATLL